MMRMATSTVSWAGRPAVADFAFIPGESFNGAIARWADEIGGVEWTIEITGPAGVR